MTKLADASTQKLRVALYACYSSDLQSAASIDDQLRLCRTLADRGNLVVVAQYADKAVSGATMLRPELQRLLTDARAGAFDVVIAEALDRLSRDQEDIAGLLKRLRFHGIALMTCSEGEIDELHVGLKGTMNALFLKDLATKTHRGLEGRVRQGHSAGGLSFGYDVVASDGDDRGKRSINVAEAEIVKRIFSRFAAGSSPIAIAKQLNDEEVPGPGGRHWLDTTIRGHALRGTGILRNELYVGKLIWNRLRYTKDPDTGRRLSRLNPKTEWITEDVPQLRIVDQDLWDRVAARLATVRSQPSVIKRQKSEFWLHRRPANFTTGRVFCGGCLKQMAVIGKDYLGCNYARRRGTCSNRKAVRRSAIEAVVIDGLKSQLMAPELVKEFISAFHAEANRRVGEQAAERLAMERELPQINKKISGLVDAIASGVRTSAVLGALHEAEARKLEIEESLSKATPTAIRLHPALADLYRDRVANLHVALANQDCRAEATEIIRSLIEKIVITSSEGSPQIELHGDLAMMVELAQGAGAENTKAARMRAALNATDKSSVKVVAGAGFEPTTFRL